MLGMLEYAGVFSGLCRRLHNKTGLNTRQDGPPQGGPPQNPKIRKNLKKTMFFGQKLGFLHLQAEIYPTVVEFFDLEP